MKGGGRSLRFLVAVFGGWAIARVVVLWPVDVPVPAQEHLAAAEAASALAPAMWRDEQRVRLTAPTIASVVNTGPRPSASAANRPAMILTATSAMPSNFALTSPGTRPERPIIPAEIPRSAANPLPPAPTQWRAPRLTGSGWLILRGGNGDGATTGFGATLGASQAGIRMTYAIDEARRLAVAGRISGALGSRQREAAAGVDWQPTSLPIHLVAERRIALDGGRDATAAGVIAGLNPTPVGGGFRLEAYGQAGVIWRDGRQSFADGAARVAKPVAELGTIRLDLGAGVWGGAQRGAARVDIGPSLGMAVPTGSRTLRINLEWRQRITGNARPGSGAALSIGTDF